MLHMSKNLMALQGMIVVLLLSAIVLIWYNKQDKEYIAYTRDLRHACERYMADKKIELKPNQTAIIFLEDLLEQEYISEIKDEYCIKSVTYTKELILGSYKANKDCTKVENNETEVEENNTIEENETIEE